MASIVQYQCTSRTHAHAFARVQRVATPIICTLSRFLLVNFVLLACFFLSSGSSRTLGRYPGVRISEAVSPITLAALVADRHCGEDTKLIFYMNPGELLSRRFTSKDTHSAAGDLLVMYAEVGLERTRPTFSSFRPCLHQQAFRHTGSGRAKAGVVYVQGSTHTPPSVSLVVLPGASECPVAKDAPEFVLFRPSHRPPACPRRPPNRSLARGPTRRDPRVYR